MQSGLNSLNGGLNVRIHLLIHTHVCFPRILLHQQRRHPCPNQSSPGFCRVLGMEIPGASWVISETTVLPHRRTSFGPPPPVLEASDILQQEAKIVLKSPACEVFSAYSGVFYIRDRLQNGVLVLGCGRDRGERR